MATADKKCRARLPSLYSDFTVQRHANPDGFAANAAAWISVLAKAAQAGLLPAPGAVHDTLSIKTGEDLLRSLETKEWGRPLALGTVIDEAVSQRQMLPYEEFQAGSKSIYNRRWTVQPWWLLSWGLNQLGIGDPLSRPDKLPIRRFVIVRNVEDAASKILKDMANRGSRGDQIFPMTLFAKEATKAIGLKDEMTESDLSIVLKHLARDKDAIVYDCQGVRFKGPKDRSSTFSHEDKTIASLKGLIADLNIQVDRLSTRISTLSGDAQRAVQLKNPVSATAALRSKKIAETTLSQRLETLSQLEEVYNKINQATDQVAAVRIMEASTTVLRSLHAEVGGVERAEDVVEGLKDEMQQVDEIGNVIEAGAQERAAIDDDAVDEELEEMIRDVKAQEEDEDARQTQKRLAEISSIKDSQAQSDAVAPAQLRYCLETKETIPTNEVVETVGRMSLGDGQPVCKTHETSKGAMPNAEAGN